MRKFLTLIVLCLLFSPLAPASSRENASSVPGQDTVRLPLEEAILFLSGVPDISEVTEDELERYSMLRLHPLRLNRCSRSTLQASGLFTRYQIETIMDYRARHGDILSPTELSIVDGFNPRLVSYLVMFLDFSPKRADGVISPGNAGGGASKNGAVRVCAGDIAAGAAIKINDGKGSWQWKARTAIEVDSNAGEFSFSAAVKSPWQFPAPLPQDLSWSLSWGDTNGISKLTAGCFNVRQGQGLLLWTGAQFSSYSTPSALMKRPSGIAAYRSYSPTYSMSGLAASVIAGRFSINPFLNFGNILTHIGRTTTSGATSPEILESFGGNIAWNHRNGQIGINALISSVRQGYSSDFQYTISGVALYGELCCNIEGIGWKGRTPTLSKSLSALLGITLHTGPVEYGLRLSRQKDHNISAAMSWLSSGRRHSLDFGITASGSLSTLRQGSLSVPSSNIKSQATYKALPDSSWQFTTRLYVNAKKTESQSNSSKSATMKCDIRQDIRYAYSGWRFSGRLNFAYSRMPAWLGYAECGYIVRGSAPFHMTVSAYGQAGIFKIDSWDDRIYVYMRDAPGNFNVPAMYGRGYWLSAYVAAKFLRHISLDFRILYTGYPWARSTDTHRRPSLSSSLLFRFDF